MQTYRILLINRINGCTVQCPTTRCAEICESIELQQISYLKYVPNDYKIMDPATSRSHFASDQPPSPDGSGLGISSLDTSVIS